MADAVLNTIAQQFSINLPLSSPTYFIDSRAMPGTTPYQFLPLPNTAYAPQNAVNVTRAIDTFINNGGTPPSAPCLP